MNSLSGASDQGATILDYLDHHVTVTAQRNARGAWVSQVQITRDGNPVQFDMPQEATPEWLTADEAMRAGLERARLLIERRRGAG
ncbi:hypothetical protein KQH49_12170 [Mycetohabitans sp. B5]|uniref:DUF6566 domain-containing protein n=1 Tax=Mycetohabitans endofungorum TaxID=417203 RepID=A0A2P5KCR5_9BURK|nr:MULTISPECIES: DUF6566 family protein [Mycetohabitans]MCG1055640.1 hypothetical protein [Mycetohabitans sp. B5]PPB84503.1 hypothetical protein B0O95_103194 [Mycetohabitans endofungorum]